MKLLIIEDQLQTAGFLRKGFVENGFTVDVAHDGREGESLTAQGGYDLVILDLLLPNRDGWTFLSGMRRADRQTPVLILSARDSVPDKVRGLELGADDYLVKPFAFSELLARSRSLLRRGNFVQEDVLRIADLELDLARQRVSRAGERIPLTAKQFSLLSLLVRRSGEILSRTLIAEQVWNVKFDSGTNVIDVAVRRLRSRMDCPYEPRLIHSVRGMGYVLEER